MAVRNTLVAKKNSVNTAAAKFEVNGMEVKLTPELVRNYLVSGNKEAVSIQELAMFINLCKYNHLNPWLKEAYCIKYGTEPATMVIGKEAYLKRAEDNKNYDGADAGIITIDKESGEVNYRQGTMKLPTDDIIGGWAEVWRKDRTHSTRVEVSFDEYAGRKKDGTLNGQWSKKPATMIRKVALVQALREAFPEAYGGMVTAEEAGTADVEPAMVPVNAETGELIEEAAPAKQIDMKPQETMQQQSEETLF